MADMTAALLAQGLARLQRPVMLLITHMEPGKEDATMAEVVAACAKFQPKRLEQGRIFEF